MFCRTSRRDLSGVRDLEAGWRDRAEEAAYRLEQQVELARKQSTLEQIRHAAHEASGAERDSLDAAIALKPGATLSDVIGAAENSILGQRIRAASSLPCLQTSHGIESRSHSLTNAHYTTTAPRSTE